MEPQRFGLGRAVPSFAAVDESRGTSIDREPFQKFASGRSANGWTAGRRSRRA
jgi:hypothetical protein